MTIKSSHQILFFMVATIFSGFLFTSQPALSETLDANGSPIYNKINNLSDPKVKKILTEMLFSTKVTPSTEYTSDPIGTINVDKLVQGDEKFWQVQGESRKKLIPKHLVINDWTLAGNNPKNVELKKMINDFIPKGKDQYKLFVWQVDHLVEIKTEEDLNNIDYTSITPASQELMQRKLFTEYNISSDQSAFLNIANIRKIHQLLNGLENKDNWVKITDIFLDKNSQDVTFIALNDIKNLMVKINLDDADIDIDEILPIVQKLQSEGQGYKFKITCSLQQLLKFNPFGEEWLIQPGAELRDEYKQSKKFYQSFEEIELNNEDLDDISLEHDTALTSWTSGHYESLLLYTIEKWALDNVSLNKAERISLWYCDAKQTRWVLQHTPNVKKFSYYYMPGSSSLFAELQLDTIRLDKLTQLKAASCLDLDLETLLWFLQHAPNIEIIICPSHCFSTENIKWLIEHAPNLNQATLALFQAKVEENEKKAKEAKEAEVITQYHRNAVSYRSNIRLTNDITLDNNVNVNSGPMERSTTKIFIPLDGGADIATNAYRLGVYNELDKKTLKFLQKPGNLQEIKNIFCDSNPKLSIKNNNASGNVYYGKYKISIPVNVSVPIPSLSAYETLSHLFVPEIKKAELSSKLKVSYSKDQNLYYLTNIGTAELNITPSFILTIDKKIPENALNNGEVNKLIKKIKNFKEGTEDINKTGLKLFEEIFAKEVGACRHRAQVFMWKIEEFKKNKIIRGDIAARVIYNDIHAYVEIRENKDSFWVAVDLGGYPANVTIDGSVLNDVTAEVIQLLQVRSATKQIEEKTDEKIANKKCGDDLIACEAEINVAEKEIRDSLSSSKDISDDTKKTILNKLDKSIENKKEEIRKLKAAKAEGPKAIKETPAKTDSSSDKIPVAANKTKEGEPSNQKKSQKPSVVVAQEAQPLEEVNEFFEKIVGIASKNQNLLLKLPKEDIDAAHLLLHKIANKHKKPVYYIDNPDDLIMHAKSLRIGAKISSGTFASEILNNCPLRDFLLTNKDESKPNAILIINWHNFPKDKFVSCHSVIDKDRNINNESLPENMLVVSLYPKNSDSCYQGSDFIERHTIQMNSNYDSTKLHEEISSILDKDKLAPVLDHKQQRDAYVELNGSEQWLNYVMGNWSITPEGYVFTQGALSKILESGAIKNVVLQNAPWDSRDFILFLQKLVLDGHVEYYGKTLTIPGGFKFYQKQGFDWQAKANVINELDSSEAYTINPNSFAVFMPTYMCDRRLTQDKGIMELNAETYIINPTLFAAFMATYICDHDGNLIQNKGILELNSGKKINLLITRNITIGQWHELLTKANDCNVKLHISLAPNVVLPDELEFLVLNHGPQQALNKQNNIEVYLTKDIDNVSAAILKSNKSAKVITVSEHEQSDIFYKIDRINNNNLFQESISDVWQALRNKETIILRGHVSPFLADGLASLITQGYFLHNGIKETINGRLIIVSDSEELNYCQGIVENNPLIETTTINEGPLIEAEQEQELAKEISDKWFKNRIDLLETALARKPWVYIEGPTGCGKSTVVNFGLSDKKYIIFDGINHFEEWVNYKGEKTPVMFIDEANLTGKNFAIFRDLEGPNPAILLQGKYIPLKNHRVIFAGNPTSYGAGRHDPELLCTHAAKVVFKSIPSAVLYNDILKPLKPGKIKESVWQNISTKWLTEYQNANKAKLNPSLTPRQLESMALLFNATITPNDSESSLVIKANKVANQIYGPYLKNKDLDLTVEKPSAEIIKEMAKDGFIYTASRYEAYAACMGFLKIRDLKIKNNNLAKIPGLGGVILSGEPGVGKSAFIRAILKAHKYTEYKNTALEPDPKTTFIYLASDASYEQKNELLTKAYYKGYIVIIDEINTPLYENLLNGLIGTKTNKEKAPGFMVFGTQNPAYMPGREITSLATQHRFLPLDLPSYTFDELCAIERAKRPSLKEEQLKEILSACKNEGSGSYRRWQACIERF